MARDLNKSPFPGMDPYLESLWNDAHHALSVYVSDSLRLGLPKGIIRRIGVREVGESDPTDIASPRLRSMFRIGPLDEALRHGFVQLIDLKRDHQVVTIIDFTTPFVRGSAVMREAFRKTQTDRVENGINVVVIDLIRSGRSVYEATLEQIPNQHRAPYCIWIWCAGKPEQTYAYPIRLQESVPIVRVPLRPESTPVNLDLQPLLERVYANGSLQ